MVYKLLISVNYALHKSKKENTDDNINQLKSVFKKSNRWTLICCKTRTFQFWVLAPKVKQIVSNPGV